MKCPYCRTPTSVVYGGHFQANGLPIYRRRRSCPKCNERFTTREQPIAVDPNRLVHIENDPVPEEEAPQGEASVSTSNALP
ncbi:hypothetical protein [Planctomyces sp. SH-PL14]|uniref:NrdR family transcriptional regulator n=1 Tax=Planctomyces sp. SH-PL14 TaxID=1632864 RepID=UPI00078EAF8A|nr:hypothetical protein [Planctomyces sp. SH-PL14]AMV16585.1 Transcriptional repressor NrdR [Planctomyces sp. SH-PL14]